MYSNEYDDGSLMNSYIKWSTRLARLHQRTLRIVQEYEHMHRDDEESEEVKADEEFCSKCRGVTTDGEENTASFPHIQDLCPADRKRIAQLVKQLIKCTKEMRNAKSELAVSESEKEAMKNQYQMMLDRRETEKKQLEYQLNQAQGETNELKTRISRILELLTRQIAAQEKQFLELTETQTESNTLRGKFQRTKELLEAERLERCKNAVEMVHRACQTDLSEIALFDKKSVQEECDKESTSSRSQKVRIKRRNDLEVASTESILLRELFFRRPSVEENGALDVIPVLSETDLQTKRSNSIPFI
ncbi:uncharacterized protein LOC117603277 isoform X4 [Osmia lignaria lignaria]|uniref:uncharacterized protein LOC117603277 isoform X4 n=1 Tax=Osmia lignaria lignaria TaxID=1437193 RepID=UPI00402B87A2